MQTTKSKRRTKTLSVLLVAAIGFWGFWEFGFEATNRVRFDLCQIQTPEGIEVLSRDAALAMFETARVEKTPLAKASLSCSYWPTMHSGDSKLNDVGLTKQAQAVINKAEKVFGYIPKGGYAPGGVNSGHIKGSAHYEGRAVDFFFRPHEKKKNREAGWQLAIWATLHAAELNIETVIFDDHIWTRLNSTAGWRPYVHPSGDRENPILRHLDHVHIDVN
ncbi:MAG: hypothetical protein RL038_343 [Actinomycetota bacterium]